MSGYKQDLLCGLSAGAFCVYIEYRDAEDYEACYPYLEVHG